MVRRFYITGGNNEFDPIVGATTITDPYFIGKEISGLFREGYRYSIPQLEYTVNTEGDTVEIDAPSLMLNEVVTIEVGPRRNTISFPGVSDEITDVEPYLPDIIKLAVARVSSVFSTREDDAFSVYYGKGLYEQVGKDRFLTDEGFVLVWLVMPFAEDGPIDNSYFADANCKVLIAVNTNANYTQQQREDINFHPRLIPVYKQFIYELKNEPKLLNADIITHTRRLLPYWGGGDVNGGGQTNLWKNYVDAIEINNLKLKIGHLDECLFTSNF